MTETKPEPASEPERPPFLRRLGIAMGAFFKTLSDPEFAARVDALHVPPLPATLPAPVVAAAAPPALRSAAPDAALQLLGLLQREARLIDFTQEDVSQYSDADIGAAARVVHEGCCKVLREHFSIAPVRSEPEGSRIRLEAGFDATAIRLSGNVVGTAPFQGSLSHRGWRVTEVRLPRMSESHDTSIIAQAEVEL